MLLGGTTVTAEHLAMFVPAQGLATTLPSSCAIIAHSIEKQSNTPCSAFQRAALRTCEHARVR